MTRTSPAIGRVVAILNFLGDHPTQAFTLTDIVRALKLSRATCHAILAGLVEAGYLYRTVDKTYMLGGALARIGKIAEQNLSQFQVVGSEIRALADEFDVICAVLVKEGKEAVVRDRAISMSHIGWNIPVLGSRLSVRPPLGGIFFAWSQDAEIRQWQASAREPMSQEESAELIRRLGIVRERGYAVDVRRVPIKDEEHARSLVYRIEQSDYLIPEIDPDQIYQLASVEAPVIDDRGSITFVLALMGFTSGMPGSYVERVGKALRAACDRIGLLSHQGPMMHGDNG
jgi:DNA-binding IclR family transcriptional regulator